MRPIIILAASLLVGTAVSAPAALSKRIFSKLDPNTQTCTIHGKTFWADFTVQVGVSYNGGSGCDGIKQNMRDTSLGEGDSADCEHLDFGKWRCDDDGQGGTVLRFDVAYGQAQCNYPGDLINHVLSQEYPMVTGGFNCDQ
ncbi:hypothetical protein LTR85_008049 [Meristemomyces frigidus]|nr:hypothetical protein LTR85_008049 [Meristemomyces frigidus]